MKTYKNRLELIYGFLDRYESLQHSEQESNSIRIFSIRSTHPNQVDIEIYYDTQTNYVSITAGLGFTVDDLYWEGDDFPVEGVLESLAQGRLIEIIRLFHGKQVGVRSYLSIDGMDAPIYSNKTIDLIGDLIHRFTGDEAKIEYEPY